MYLKIPRNTEKTFSAKIYQTCVQMTRSISKKNDSSNVHFWVGLSIFVCLRTAKLGKGFLFYKNKWRPSLQPANPLLHPQQVSKHPKRRNRSPRAGTLDDEPVRESFRGDFDNVVGSTQGSEGVRSRVADESGTALLGLQGVHDAHVSQHLTRSCGLRVERTKVIVVLGEARKELLAGGHVPESNRDDVLDGEGREGEGDADEAAGDDDLVNWNTILNRKVSGP